VTAKLTTHAIDVLLLGELQRRPDSPALLRTIRAGEHQRIHPAQPVITLAATDELTTLRAYEAGSDHHLPADTGDAGGDGLLKNVWGTGYALTSGGEAR